MTNVTIFGTGTMGQAIGDVLTAGGASVQHIDTSTPQPASVSGDIVVLAVPYPALGQIAEQYGDQLAGKTVVETTNPLDFDTFDSLVVPAGSSATAQLAAALPDSHVLKAFNTNFAATLAARTVGEITTTVQIAGDDESAKHALASVLRAGGVDAIDAGSLRRARELEAMGFLQLTLAASEKIAWTGGFAVVR